MYKDIEKKITFHKEKILKEFIRKGIYPNDEMIQKKINNINMFLSLFKFYNTTEGSKFNVKEYNEMLNLIYNDLIILNNILYDITLNEYNSIEQYVMSHLTELHNIVETYKNRASYENSVTTLGKTLFYKNNSFDISYDNSLTIIDLGDINIENNARIACIANINNIQLDNIIFSLKNKNNEINTAAYNYNNSILKLPGDNVIKKHIFETAIDQKTNGPLYLNINADIDNKNKYITLASKNKIYIETKNSNNKIISKDLINNNFSFYFKEKTFASFYIVGGKTISFKTNKKPLNCNFNIEDKINNLDYIHYFYIECDENFAFDFTIDSGEIYAIKEQSILNGDKLYYSNIIPSYDFLICEYLKQKEEVYNVYLKIYNSNNSALDIKDIVIKQIE